MKNNAYNFLIKNRINTLNFNLELLEEISLSKGWKLCPFSKNKNLIISFNLENNLELEAFTVSKNNKILIFYNDKLHNNDIIFNILHEFGHIFLEHTNENNILGCSLDAQKLVQQENEANEFACEVLAPSCVLSRLNIKSTDDLLRYSNIPIKHAILHLTNVNNFRSVDELSEKLIKIFSEFILKNNLLNKLHNIEETRTINNSEEKERYKIKQLKNGKNKPLILGLVGMLAMLILFITIQIRNKNVQVNSPSKSNNNSTINREIISGQIFYTTKTGSKYHIEDCHYIKNKNNTIEIKSDTTAINKYSPCSVCIK